MLDKNSGIYEIVEELKNKNSVSASNPYPYLSGLIWGMLNETQIKKLISIVNGMENK